MIQTGLLYKFDPKDYRVGASPLNPIILNPTSDWTNWKPLDEKQFKDYAFDTMSCATFSALNVMETTVNFLMYNDKITVDKLEWLNKNGYIVNGKMNCSDRFTAIMSGTTSQGNSMQNVWESIRKVGCIPESDLPFGGNNWNEYMNHSLITQAMLDKAKQFLDIFDASYEWTTILPADIKVALEQCPLQVAINNGGHAVELINPTTRYDSYPPFLIPQTTPLTYALKGMINTKQPVVITRTSDNGVETLGTLTYKDFTCKTLERPWKNNTKNISCIPKGTYQCKYTFSLGKLGWCYEVQNVPGRSGIRIHPGNYFFDIEGCILLGDSYGDINKDKQTDVSNSRATIANFVSIMNKKDFTLIIN